MLAYDQFERMAMELNGDRYSFNTFISFLNLNIFNTDHAILTNSKKLDRHNFILT